MNPLQPGHSGTTPGPSRNALNTSQGMNEDDSQNDPRPEAGLFYGQMTQNCGPEDDYDIYVLWNIVAAYLRSLRTRTAEEKNMPHPQGN